MVLDSDITTHLAVDRQLTIHKQVLILIHIIRSLSVIGTVDPTDSIVVDIFVFTTFTTLALTADINTFTAIRTRTNIEFVRFVFQFDIEIIATTHTYFIQVSVSGEACYRSRVQIHGPNGTVFRIAQLAEVTCIQLHMCQVLLKTFKIIGVRSGKIRVSVHQNTITCSRHTQRHQRCCKKTKNLSHIFQL